MYKKVGIIGLGLIGGSIAKAVRSRFGVTNIVASNRSEDVLKIAFDEGVINEYSTDISPIFKDCDIIFICTPVNKIFEYAEKLTNYISNTCVVTDVGSTKGNLYKEMNTLKNCFIYIGGHPMTGSEKYRYQASKDYLFENAYYIISPSEYISSKAVDDFKFMVEAIGAIPVIVSPLQHDHIVAAISHVPHIIAAGLVNMVKTLDTDQKHMYTLAAGGFKDITRIASSSPEMWESICFDNKHEILNVIETLEDIIGNVKNSLKCDRLQEVHNYFDSARLYRDSFTSISPLSYVKRYEISVDVLDKPGSIAIIAVLFSSNNINIKNMDIVNNREQDNGVLHIAFDSEEQRTKSIELLKNMNYEVYAKN